MLPHPSLLTSLADVPGSGIAANTAVSLCLTFCHGRSITDSVALLSASSGTKDKKRVHVGYLHAVKILTYIIIVIFDFAHYGFILILFFILSFMMMLNDLTGLSSEHVI